MRPVVRAFLTEAIALSGEVTAFTFEAVDGAFEQLEPGSHVDVHLGADLIRSYSLTDWGESGRTISVAVKVESDGRGGSLAMHRLGIGDEVEIAGPRNNFPLRPTDAPAVLLGGGIGITPLYAMARALMEQGRAVEVHYFVRSAAVAAFDRRLSELGLGKRYLLHCDDTSGLPNFRDLIRTRSTETEYYVCGPEIMLQAVLEASRDVARGTVIFERFNPVDREQVGPDRAFEIVLDSTGETFVVPADQSILQVLREAGKDVDYSCSEGTCGSCILDVLKGEIDHRDSILTDEEKDAGDCLCICVSRARGPQLVLDL